MSKVHTDKDAGPSVLKNKTLAVPGFGSPGHTHALNLQDSKCNLILSRQSGFGSVCI